jgi:hypothetical protein
MLSALGNSNLPPLTSVESQDPSLFRQGLANFKDNMASPKGMIVSALMQQQLSKMGKLFSPAQLQHQPTALDQYGNPLM